MKKGKYTKRCQYCGKKLPVDFKFNICNECYRAKNIIDDYLYA